MELGRTSRVSCFVLFFGQCCVVLVVFHSYLFNTVLAVPKVVLIVILCFCYASLLLTSHYVAPQGKGGCSYT
jgi:hypothetical protein